MPVYEYIAKDSVGNEFSGVYSEVDDVKSLRSELAKMDYKLVSVSRGKKKGSKSSSKIKRSEVISFAYEFAGMYSAGLSIVRCLETFESQIENPAFGKVISDIREQIETGSSLTDAFEKYRSLFSDFFLGMIEAGETGGKLGDTLHMAATYLEKQADMRNKVKGAFAYPVVVTVMCLLIVSALVIFVIPVFEKLYSQLKVPLPGPTMMLIFTSNVARNYWMVALPSVIVGAIAIVKVVKIPAVRARLDSMLLRLPVFGKLSRMILVSRFIRTFSMMLAAGVSIVDSLELAKRVANNSEMEKIATVIQEEVMTGHSLAGPMSRFKIFPPMIIQLAAAGEEAGIVAEMLCKGVDFLDSNIDRAISSLITKIEPVLSVLMGLIVGSILMGVYLPMFDYMGHVK